MRKQKANRVLFLKLKASTLIETIVAMLIITIIFSLAFSIILGIGKNANNMTRTKAYVLVGTIWQETQAQKAYFDKDFSFRTITIKRSVIETDLNPELITLKVSAFNSRGKKLFEKNELIDAKR